MVDFGFTKVAEDEKSKLGVWSRGGMVRCSCAGCLEWVARSCVLSRGRLLKSTCMYVYFTRAPPSTVGQVFHSVADKYDLMNDLMSGGIHRVWKDHFVSKLSPMPGSTILDVAGGTGVYIGVTLYWMTSCGASTPGERHCSGDIAFRMVEHMRTQQGRGWGGDLGTPSVVVCDINTSMLEVGVGRASERGIQEGVCLCIRTYTLVNAPKLSSLPSVHDPDLVSWVAGDAEKLPFADNMFDAYTIAFGVCISLLVEDPSFGIESCLEFKWLWI